MLPAEDNVMHAEKEGKGAFCGLGLHLAKVTKIDALCDKAKWLTR